MHAPKRLSPEKILFLLFLAIGLVIVFLMLLRQPVDEARDQRVGLVLMAGFLLVEMVWTWRGELRWPVAVYLVVVFLGIAYGAFLYGGVQGSTVTWLLFLILLSVPIAGWGLAGVLIVLSVALVWMMALLPVQPAQDTPVSVAVNLTALLVSVSVLVWWYHRQQKAVADRLRKANSELESRVEERTQQVLVSEKLATVGRLSASLSHELNTPLGAVASAHSSADLALRSGLVHAMQTLSLVDATHRLFLEDLVGRCLGAGPESVVGAPGRERKKVLLTWAAEAGFPEETAETLAEGLRGLPGLTRDELVRLGSHPQWRVSLALVESSLSLVRALAIIGNGVGKMSQVVRSYQSLSRQESTAPAVAVDPCHEIDAALLLCQGRIPPAVTVECRCVEGVRLFCRPDRFGRVLVNLITNALQAMEGRGRLGLLLSVDGREGVLEVTDTGAGVPAELHDRIFEPFFTTKPPGEGNGLGLDLARRFCEEEGGSLQLIQEPGLTRFVVRLPLAVDGGPSG